MDKPIVHKDVVNLFAISYKELKHVMVYSACFYFSFCSVLLLHSLLPVLSSHAPRGNYTV